MLEEMLREMAREERPSLPREDAIAALKAAFAAYTTQHSFQPGDLIQQKDGIASGERGGKRGQEPCIFIRYEPLAAERYEKMDMGHAYTQASPDCLVGWIEKSGGVVIAATHAAIYEPFDPETNPEKKEI